jgi:putative transposase
MSTEKSRKSKEEKLQILKEASQNGITITCEKYGIYPATYYTWKKKYEEMGEAGFRHGMTPDQLKEIKRLQKENQQLKELLISKELEGKLKDELIKKKYAQEKRRS